MQKLNTLTFFLKKGTLLIDEIYYDILFMSQVWNLKHTAFLAVWFHFFMLKKRNPTSWWGKLIWRVKIQSLKPSQTVICDIIWFLLCFYCKSHSNTILWFLYQETPFTGWLSFPTKINFFFSLWILITGIKKKTINLTGILIRS